MGVLGRETGLFFGVVKEEATGVDKGDFDGVFVFLEGVFKKGAMGDEVGDFVPFFFGVANICGSK